MPVAPNSTCQLSTFQPPRQHQSAVGTHDTGVAAADAWAALCSRRSSRRWTAALTSRAVSPPPRPRGAPTTGATGWCSTRSCSRARATPSGCLTSARTCLGLPPGSLVRLQEGGHRPLLLLQGLLGLMTAVAVRCCSRPPGACRRLVHGLVAVFGTPQRAFGWCAGMVCDGSRVG